MRIRRKILFMAGLIKLFQLVLMSNLYLCPSLSRVFFLGWGLGWGANSTFFIGIWCMTLGSFQWQALLNHSCVILHQSTSSGIQLIWSIKPEPFFLSFFLFFFFFFCPFSFLPLDWWIYNVMSHMKYMVFYIPNSQQIRMSNTQFAM